MVKVGGLRIKAVGRIVVTAEVENIPDHPLMFATEEMMEVNTHGCTKLLVLDTGETMEKTTSSRVSIH